MEVRFSQDDQWVQYIGDKRWIRDALLTPDGVCNLKLDERHTASLVAKTVGDGSRLIIVLANTEPAHVDVLLALMAPRELLTLVGAPMPLKLLEALAGRFGETIRIGDRASTFFVDTLLPVRRDTHTDIVQLSSDQPCISFVLAKAIGKPPNQCLHIRLALALNEDRYAKWLGLERTQFTDVAYFIAPMLRHGGLNPRMLVSYAGLGALVVRFETIDNGHLFAIQCPGYHLAAKIENRELVLLRNDCRIAIPFEKVGPVPGDFKMTLQWLPEALRMAVGCKQTGKDVFEEVKTTAVRPPNRLLRWARQRGMIPVLQYESAEHLYETVSEAIDSAEDTIKSNAMFAAFWDYEARGAKKPRRDARPKSESHIQPTIHSLLGQIAIAKNLEISREPVVGSGNLDFLVTGHVAGQGSMPVCIEAKLAHSNRIFHGLETQLPAYMDTKAAEFGIYLVLWFRGPEFDQPKTWTLNQLFVELNRRGSRLGRNIRVVVLDLSKPPTPSKS